MKMGQPPMMQIDEEDRPGTPTDELSPCTWFGHCECFHRGEPCCNCEEVPNDYEEE